MVFIKNIQFGEYKPYHISYVSEKPSANQTKAESSAQRWSWSSTAAAGADLQPL